MLRYSRSRFRKRARCQRRITVLPCPVGSQAIAELRRKIQVGLFNGIAQARHQRIEFWNSRKVAVDAARIANVTQTVGESKVLFHFPIVTHVGADAIVGDAARRVTEGRGRREISQAIAQVTNSTG